MTLFNKFKIIHVMTKLYNSAWLSISFKVDNFHSLVYESIKKLSLTLFLGCLVQGSVRTTKLQGKHVM